MRTINSISHTVIGLCCMSPDNAEYGHVHSTWEARFDQTLLMDVVDRNGDWMNADDIIRALLARVTESRGRVINGQQLVVALFVDMRTRTGGLLNSLDELKKELFKVFQKHCACAIIFGYAGCVGQEKDLYETKANTVSALLAAPCDRVCLLASDYRQAGSDQPWQPVMLLLDLLRRTGNVLQAFTSDQRLGYLEYSEFLAEERLHLEKKLERITLRLGIGGGGCIKDALNQRVKEINRDVGVRFEIDAGLLPMHEWAVQDNRFMAMLRRMRDRYTYDKVMESGRKALTATGKNLQERIEACYTLTEKEAAALFAAFSDNASLGLLLDRELMDQELRLDSEPAAVTVGTGDGADSQEYLERCKAAAIAAGQKKYVSQIRAAYQTLIQLRAYDAELTELRQMQYALDDELRTIPDLADYCQRIVVQKEDMESAFPIAFSNSGQSQTVCVCELDQPDILRALRQAEQECTMNSDPTMFYEMYALRTQKDAERAPVRMLRVNLFDMRNIPLRTDARK